MKLSLIRPSNRGIMDDRDEGIEFNSSDDESESSMGSSESEFMEDGGSSSSSSETGPLFEMSSLIAQLPFKRGLSKHYEGKSQSFTCLSNVRSLEDLAKPMKQLNKKKLKQCKSYACGLDGHKTIMKKASRGSLSSLGPKRSSFVATKPSVPPQRSASHTLLFT